MTEIDINDLVQVMNTPLYQSRKTREYFIKDPDSVDAYIPLPKEEINRLQNSEEIPNVVAGLKAHKGSQAHNPSPHEQDIRGKVNDLIHDVIAKNNHRAEIYKTQRALNEHYLKIAEQDLSEGI